MITRIIIFSLVTFAAHGMQKSVSASTESAIPAAMASDLAVQREPAPLSLLLQKDNLPIALSLATTLNHIYGYQRIIDPLTSQEKITGLHHYTDSRKKIRKYGAGVVVEFNDSLWMYTEGDRNDFHAGYLVYQGRVISDQPKTFFPCTWSEELLISNLQQAAKSEKILWHEDCIATFKTVCATIYHENVPLKLVIKHYPHMRILRTIYPEIEIKPVKESILEELAQEQSRLLKGIRQSRLTLMTDHARRHTEKSEESSRKPELIISVECALNKRADQQYWYNEICECLKAGANPNVSDDQGKTALMLAAQHGDAALMTELLESGASKGHKDRKGRTVLEYALNSCQYYAVLPFLNAEQANRLLSSGATPLTYAIDQFSIELVELLLEYDADPNMPDSWGFTPLMRAATLLHRSKEQLESALVIIKLLLESGADIDAQKKNPRVVHVKPISREDDSEGGETALMLAIRYGNERIVKAFLEAQADYTLVNEKQQTALRLAQNRRLPNVESVISTFITEKEGWIKTKNADELTYAAFKNNIRRVRKLLNHKNCRVNGHGSRDTALYHAVTHNNEELVIDLLRVGADPRLLCPFECSILQYALQTQEVGTGIRERLQDKARELDVPKDQAKERAAQRRKQAVEQFKVEVDQDKITSKTLETIKEIDPCLIDGESPLLYAVKKRKARAVEYLSKDKACYKDEKQNLLFFPQTKTEKEIVKILLRNNCARERELEKLLKDALKKERRDVLGLLNRIPNFYFNLIKGFIEKGDHEELIISLCRLDAEIISFDQAGYCLMVAISKGRSTMAKALAQSYPLAAVAYRDDNEMTVLMHAASQCMGDLCKQLIDFGADLEACDAQGRSVMDHTPQRSAEAKKLRELFETRKKECDAVEQTLAEKSDYDTKELVSRGWTPAMAAVYHNDAAAVAGFTKDEINTAGTEGLTPLHIAVIYKKNKALAALLQRHDIEVSLQDAAGLTALHHAVKHDNETVVEKLLAKKAPVLLCDKSGCSLFSVNKSNVRAVRIRGLLKNALVEEIARNASLTVPEDLRLVLSHLDKEERNDLFFDLCCAAEEMGTLDQVLKRNKEMREEFSRCLTSACRQVISFGYSEAHLKAMAYIVAHQGADIELILRYQIVEPRLLMYTAIFLDHIPLLTYLCDTFRDQMKLWKFDFFDKKLLMNHLRHHCQEPEFTFLTYEQLIPEMNTVLWAWMLKKKSVLKLFFEKKSPELSRKIEPLHMPSWIFVMCSYNNDAELGKLIREWMETDESARQFLQDREAVSNLASRGCWNAVRILLEEKKIAANQRDSNGDTLITNILQEYVHMNPSGGLIDMKIESLILAAVKDLVERFEVDSNHVNNQGISLFEFVIRNNLYAVMNYLIFSPLCSCTTRVPLPSGCYRSLVYNTVPALCSLLKNKASVVNLDELAFAAAEAKNDVLLAILLSRLNEASVENIVAYACQEANLKILKLLIEKGKVNTNKVYQPTRAGLLTGTPLMIATQKGHEVVVVLLFNVKGDTDLSIRHPVTHLTAPEMAPDRSELRFFFDQMQNPTEKNLLRLKLRYFLSLNLNQAADIIQTLPSDEIEQLRKSVFDYSSPEELSNLGAPENTVQTIVRHHVLFDAFTDFQEGKDVAHHLRFIEMITGDFSRAAAAMRRLSGLNEAKHVRELLIERFRPLAIGQLALSDSVVIQSPISTCPVKAVAMQGSKIVLALSNGAIYLTELQNASTHRTFHRIHSSGSSGITALEISSDGKYLAAGFDTGLICITDLEKKMPVIEAQVCNEPIMALAFDGAYENCLFAPKNGTVQKFKFMVDVKPELEGQQTTVFASVLSRCPVPIRCGRLLGDRKFCAVGEDGSSLHCCPLSGQTSNNIISRSTRRTTPLSSIALSEDGDTIFTAEGNKLFLAKLSDGSGQCLNEKRNEEHINDLVISRNNQWILHCTSQYLTLTDLRKYDKTRDTPISNINFARPIKQIHSIALSDDTHYALVGLDNGAIQLIDLKILEGVQDILHILFIGRFLAEGEKLLENETARQLMATLPKRISGALLKYQSKQQS